jgi:hypothetical protein
MIDVRDVDRSLLSDEREAFRSIRLRALETEPGVYATSLTEASQRSEAMRRATNAGADHQVFGLFATT